MSPESNADLDQMYLEIAMAGFPENADSFTNRIVDFCEELSQFPLRGTERPEIAPGVRTIGFRRQVTIVFHVLEQQQQVVIDRILRRGCSLPRAIHEGS